MKNKFVRFLFVLACFGLTIAFAGCDCNRNGTRTPETFDAFAQSVFHTLIGNDELTSNYLFVNPEDYGIDRYEPTLPTPGNSSAFGVLMINLYFGEVKAYDYSLLSNDQKMTYNIIVNLLDNINSKTSEMSYLSNNYLGSYLGYQAQLPLLLVEYKFKDKIDVENYFKYLDLVPETFQKYYEYEVEKADKGYGMPDFVIDNVVEQCVNFIANVSEGNTEHFMISVINEKIDNLTFLTTQEKDEYRNKNFQKVNGPLLEGYKYVKNNLPSLKGRATNNMGLAHYVTEKGDNIGQRYYEIAFKNAVGYDLTIPQAKQYIEDILADCEYKMQYYRELIQTRPNFLAEVESVQLMTGTPEEQLALYQTIIDGHFPALSSTPNVTIKYVAEAMENNFSPAAYMVSAIDDYTNEFIYLNNKSIYKTVYDEETGETSKELDYNYLYTTLAHEGFPGHMYQNIYFKNQDVNVLRKVLKNSGYLEGWATYAEMYMYKLVEGYDQDIIDFLVLQEEYSAAIYSRLDMGIHYDGWTLQETYAYLRKYYNITLEQAQPIYERLIEVPNNSQQYYFTYFKLRDLYDDITALTGEAFDPVYFHALILDCGPAPLKYVEDYVRSHYPE